MRVWPAWQISVPPQALERLLFRSDRPFCHPHRSEVFPNKSGTRVSKFILTVLAEALLNLIGFLLVCLVWLVLLPVVWILMGTIVLIVASFLQGRYLETVSELV